MLKDKVAIVTGGTRGIGREIVINLAKKGIKVSFNYVNSEEVAKELVKEIEGFGGNAVCYRADVRDYSKVKEMVDNTKETFGSIDILVNNAGITRDKPLLLMESDDWKDVIDTNLTGVFNCTKAVVMHLMKQKKGDIINITSVSGMVGLARQTNYSASKAGMIGFTKALAKELCSYNIRVNAVAPGGIETEMIEALNEKYRKDMQKSIPMGRFGTSEEVAEVVSFLLSDSAKYITGHIIPVDGGLAI